MLPFSRRVILPVLAAAAAGPGWSAPLPAAPQRDVQSIPVSPAQPSAGALALSMRRSPGLLELVVQGTGPSPVLEQVANTAGVWTGQLRTASSSGLRFGPQRIALPEAGLQSVSFSGAGRDFQIQVTPMPGAPLAKPVVSADGKDLVISFATAPQVSDQSARLDLRQPGTVPQPSFAPPLQSRAVAPPLADMAVGSMVIANRGFIKVSGPPVTLNLRNAPAVDALQTLARLGGYGFVFVDDQAVARTTTAQASGSLSGSAEGRVNGQADGAGTGGSGAASVSGAGAANASASAAIVNTGVPVTVSFVNEGFARAFNSVLLAANLQGKLDGNTIFVGPSVLHKSFAPSLSKVYRLNQASASSAADYLASLGASITKVNVITNSVTQGTSQSNQVAGASASQQTTRQEITTTETYGGGTGPLKGLLGTTDSRLQTITLIGESGVIAVAENFLRQLDLRQRQVALSVRILDVTLNNDTTIANSFAFRSGNTYVVSDAGELTAFFGGFQPNGAPNPGNDLPSNQLYDFLRAQIEARSTKVLASPTLILSENPDPLSGGSAVAVAGTGSAALATATIGRPFANESFVTVGTQVITNYEVQAGQNGAPNTCQAELDTAGLTFGARVAKIDDNGFVTFSLSPSVSAITGNQDVQGCGPINILSVRRLDTGSVRVRDGQTLILTGVISDTDSQTVTKWPILGDLPLIGQFFRGTSGTRQKNELVILVTPRIIDDTQGGSFGYGYRPTSTEAQRMMSGSM